MKTSHTMCKSKILIDLCLTKQKIKAKNTFVKVFCFSSKNVLIEHKKFVWALMVHNLSD